MAICPRTVLRGATVLKVDDKPAGETINISGFGGQGAGWKVNSNGISSPAFPKANVLRLTDDKAREARSAFYEKPVLVAVGDEGFIAAFTYTASGKKDADGVTFVLQNDSRGAEAIGGHSKGLGIGAVFGGTAIAPSVELEIKLWRGLGVAWRSNGTNGENDSYTSTTPVNVASGRPIDVRLAYDPKTLTLTVKLIDQATKVTFSTSSKSLDVLRILGGSTAYVGFTGSTATDWSIQEISNFTYSVGATPTAATTESIALKGFGGEGANWTVNNNKNATNPPFPSKDTLRLTNNDLEEARTAFYNQPVSVVNGSKGFTAKFVYRASGDRDADGAAFVLQNDPRGASALGGHGGALGLGAENMGAAVAPSVEFEINLWKTHGIAWQANADPGTYARTENVDVAGGNPIEVTLAFTPPNSLAVELVDQVTKASYSTTLTTIDVPATLGRSTAYVGFSGGSGRSRSIQHISNFTYTVGEMAGADRLVGFEGDSLVFQGKMAGAPKSKVPLADLISVKLDDQDRAAFVAAAKKPAVPTRSGSQSAPLFRLDVVPSDHLTASLAGFSDSRLALALYGVDGTTLSVPVERVRSIWSTNESNAKEARDLNVWADSQDVAFVESEGKVKSVAGVATGIDSGFLKFKFEGEERKIKLERLVGLRLAQRELPVEKSLYESVSLRNGDVVSGRIQSLADGIIRIAPLGPAGEAASLELPLGGVSSIDVRNGRLTWLGELTPKTVDQTPYFDRLMPYRVDASLTGTQLVMNDGPVSKGIAVHTKCTLEYEIGGGFDRFRAKVGFQEPDGKLGRAPVRIRGDGKLLWEETNLTGEARKPALVDLDIAGMKTLVLEADFGPDGDVGGRVIWGDARLVKAAPK
jgi:hypothetical protein